MLHRKLIARYISQIIIVGLVLTCLAITILIWMFNQYENIQLKRNFAPTGIMKLIEESEIDNQGRILNSDLLKQLEADGGWLQSLDEKGQVIQSFFTPHDVPASYNAAELIDFWLGKKDFPYLLGLWIQEKDGDTFTMLYGKKPITEHSIKPLIDDAQLFDEQIRFSNKVAAELEESNSWVQVFNNEGIEIATWNKPEYAGDSYSIQELALRNKYYVNKGVVIDSEYDEPSGQTWIIQYPVQDPLSSAVFPNLSAELQLIIVSGLLFLASSFIAFILLALWYAQRFMKPIMDIVNQIQQLGHGETHIKSKKSTKKQQKLFSEVFESISMVSDTLQRSKVSDSKTQAYREEWIAGVTHDMRTPLSSIQGYAHILASDTYQWSDEDIRGFASIMLEKSQYMNLLLDDMALTYRLKSGQLPVTLTTQNLGIVLYDAVTFTRQHTLFKQSNIKLLLPEDTDIFALIHPPWLERVMYNLIANAILHNDIHTAIVIELLPYNEHGWQIIVNDNGKGMDAETLQQLFQRYYRGTSTDSLSEGTGLGMAITKELVQAMGGQISVSSIENQGTTIQLTWL